MSETLPRHIFLIATVGGKPGPVVASIKHWKPGKVLFIPSPGTKQTVEEIHKLLENHKHKPREAECDQIEVSDPEDFPRCVEEMHRKLEEEVPKWHGRGGDYECVADFTGGTKCMAAALTMVVRPWPAVRFSYVGGIREGEAGIVVSGKEHVVRTANPWDALGYQAIEDAVAAFDRHDFTWGAGRLCRALHNVEDPCRKAELSALKQLIEAYDRWDRSEYKKALGQFKECAKRVNDLAAALPNTKRTKDEHGELQAHIREAIERLEPLKQGLNRPTHALLVDLIANADRCRDAKHHVDAVARLYRAVELAAQLRLCEQYGIETGKVPLDKLPKTMRDRLNPQAREDGTLKLGLQDAYEILRHEKDPLGQLFVELGWHDRKKSPLSERNQSIAGHGFQPVSKETSDTLWEGTLRLAELSDEEVYRFPMLGEKP